MAGKRFEITAKDNLTGRSCGLDFKDGVAIVDIVDGDVRAVNGLQNAMGIHGAGYRELGTIDDKGKFTPAEQPETKEKSKKEEPAKSAIKNQETKKKEEAKK